MGGLFSSPPSSGAASVAKLFSKVYQQQRFATVLDVFVSQSGTAEILVLFPDGTIQQWGKISDSAVFLGGPRFNALTREDSDLSSLKQLASKIKFRQEADLYDASKTNNLEAELKREHIPIDLTMGYKYVCGIVQKARLLTNDTKQSYEQC